MKVQQKSFQLQCIGLECFYLMLGSNAIDEELPIPRDILSSEPLSDGVRSSLIATIMSLATSDHDDESLCILKDAIQTVVDYYHTSMSPANVM